MTGDSGAPRVTLGVIARGDGAAIGETIASCLQQDFPSLEVVVVRDADADGSLETLLAATGDPRLRVLRSPDALGAAAAANLLLAQARGQFLALLGDGERCLPGRVRRQVAVFDRMADTGIVHGDATLTGGKGAPSTPLTGTELSSSALLRHAWRTSDLLLPSTVLVHRRVYDALGGYDESLPLLHRLELALRAAGRFRLRHTGGEALVAIDRATVIDPSALPVSLEMERALEAMLERTPLRTLVPELDWPLLDGPEGERQAAGRLALELEHRTPPLAGLAARLLTRAEAIPPPRRGAPTRGRLLMTSFGFDDNGGGTTVPRLAAKELARRGWDVTVFCAATTPTPSGAPYEVSERESDGVRIVAVHNRPHGLFDLGHPARELEDPAITAAFTRELQRRPPDMVHFHNLHNLGAALIDVVAARGIPSYFTTHNYWLICPRAYLLDGQGGICAGPGDGSRCASCVGSHDVVGHQTRLAAIRATAQRGLTSVLAVSDAVRGALLGAGYDPELVDVVRQAMPQDGEIWEACGRDRAPGRAGERLVVGFLGSAYPHKGPQLLVEAAQRTDAEVEVRIFGEVPPAFARQLRAADRRGVVTLEGAFSPTEIPRLLSGIDAVVLPSLWWDCAPLAAAECLAARTPLLVPRLGGLPEAVRDGVDGLTFAGGDGNDLARQIDRLAAEDGLLERLQAGIDEPRSFASYVDELEAYYAGGRPGARPARGSSPPCVRWQGDHGLPTSLSIINDRVTEQLDCPVQRVRIDGGALDRALPHTAEVEVRHQWPPDLSPARSGRLAVIQPWEFGAIPSDWLAPLQTNVDELWVPSDYVRSMYLSAGLHPDRVLVIPNGVDLDAFSPAREPRSSGGIRFLFVGGLIPRKGPDLLLSALITAFRGREDVALVVKDFGADGIYRDGDRARFAEHVASGALPRVELIDATLDDAELAELYRSCDVLVTPYRGEGFCMPALEAMACGLPVISTAGGPTDEFVPEDAGWRIASHRREFPDHRVAQLETCERPWMLEPDLADLVRCLREAEQSGPQERHRRGARGRAAAAAFSWDAVAERYSRAIARLASDLSPRRPIEPWALEGEAGIRLLATPAWRGADRLGELLQTWARCTSRETDACLYLLADPNVDGTPEELEARVLTAAAEAGADLDGCADIDVVMAPARAGRDMRVHAAVDAYVPLHDACAGHLRMSSAVVRLGTDELEALLALIPDQSLKATA